MANDFKTSKLHFNLEKKMLYVVGNLMLLLVVVLLY